MNFKEIYTAFKELLPSDTWHLETGVWNNATDVEWKLYIQQSKDGKFFQSPTPEGLLKDVKEYLTEGEPIVKTFEESLENVGEIEAPGIPSHNYPF